MNLNDMHIRKERGQGTYILLYNKMKTHPDLSSTYGVSHQNIKWNLDFFPLKIYKFL